jgi:hypothetical protein
MSDLTPKTILLRGDPLYGEARATAEIRPGMVITTSGGVRTMRNDPTCAPATAGAVAPIVARENDIVGKRIDDNYAVGDNVLFIHLRRGDQVYALLANGVNVAVGGGLSVGPGGLLVLPTAGSATGSPVTAVTFPTAIVFRALTGLNNTTGSPARIKVEVV